MPKYFRRDVPLCAPLIGLVLALVTSSGRLYAQSDAAPLLDSPRTGMTVEAQLPDAPSVTMFGAESPSVGEPGGVDGMTQQATAAAQDKNAARNPAPTQTGDSDGGPVQTKRIAGIMPNFRSVTADVVLPPQSAKDKLEIAAHDTFDYSAFIIVAIQAGISFNGESYPEFHQGVMGYTRYYWHTFADTADENFMVGGLGPVLFHQDSRFYTLGHGTPLKRLSYAASRILITRTNAGKPMFNFSEVVGAGAAAGLSSVYYPTVYRDWTKVGQKWLTSMLIDSANFSFKEYWPEINHKLFHSRKHAQAAAAAAAAQTTP